MKTFNVFVCLLLFQACVDRAVASTSCFGVPVTTPANAQVQFKRAQSELDTDELHFTCDEGYVLRGAPVRVCKNGKWAGVNPECEALGSDKTCNGVPGLCNLRFNQITLPGTFNSGAYGLTKGAKTQPYKQIIENLATAQSKTFLEQLEAGVRAVDLEPCCEGGETYDNFQVCHGEPGKGSFGGRGDNILDMLKELHEFANRPGNVREVFMVRFHDHRPNNCNNLIHLAVRTALCPNTSTDCPHLYQPSESSTQWPTLAEMLQRGQRYVVVTEGDRHADYSYLLSQKETLDSVPGDKTDDADRKASSVTAKCLSTSVKATKLFDQALVPFSCTTCSNLFYDSNSKENLAVQLNGWRLFNVTSHCLASRLSRGGTINAISSEFFHESLVFPLAQAANSINLARHSATNTASQDSGQALDISVQQVRRVLLCHVTNYLDKNVWNSKGCFRQYETASSAQLCAQCSESKPVYDHGLCYPKCRAGFYGVGPVCWSMTETTKGRGVGKIPQNCPPHKPDKEAGLCYENCRSTYTGLGPLCSRTPSYARGAGLIPTFCPTHLPDLYGYICYPYCRPGYRGEGPVCWKRKTKSYDRGPGTVPSRCPSDRPDYYGGLCYKRCRSGYKRFGCCLCKIIGGLKSYGRGAGTVPHSSCPSTRPHKQGGLCYKSCRADYTGVLTVCWLNNPSYGRGVGETPSVCPPEQPSKEDGLCYKHCPDTFPTRAGPLCWREGAYGRGVGVVPNGCASTHELDAGLCYPRCPDGTFAAGPVCWAGYGRGVGGPITKSRQQTSANRGAAEIQQITMRFFPLSSAEKNQCLNNPNAITL